MALFPTDPLLLGPDSTRRDRSLFGVVAFAAIKDTLRIDPVAAAVAGVAV